MVLIQDRQMNLNEQSEEALGANPAQPLRAQPLPRLARSAVLLEEAEGQGWAVPRLHRGLVTC